MKKHLEDLYKDPRVISNALYISQNIKEFEYIFTITIEKIKRLIPHSIVELKQKPTTYIKVTIPLWCDVEELAKNIYSELPAGWSVLYSQNGMLIYREAMFAYRDKPWDNVH